MTDVLRGVPAAVRPDTPAPAGGNAPLRFHGAKIRGADNPTQSPLFEGRFGRMFRSLPPARHSEQALRDLAARITAEAEEEETPETEPDAEENPGIASGYTYLGQFIDHDLTFDPASSLQRENDPDALVDFRTPRFDLDSVYGRGPADQPYLYAADGLHMLLGRTLTGSAFDANTRDLLRNTPPAGEPARALIGDPRNDENMIVAQLHSSMLRFHNRMVDVLQQRLGVVPTFESVQREVRYHYQWVVLHDFLPTIIGDDAVRAILPQFRRDFLEKPYKPDLEFYKFKHDPFIPVEFSVAAYRFGHSMVRPSYRMNTTLPGRQSIFMVPTADADDSLAGMREIPVDRGIDWTLFFHIESRPPLGPQRVQPAYKIDSSLVTPLGHLPDSVATVEHALATRNLLRGRSMGLPSGQAVASKMDLPVIPDDKLRVGKATEEDQASNPRLVEISRSFAHNAPLWYYVLAEAQQAFVNDTTPIRLGPVGGRIVGETFVGLLFGDAHSYVRQYPTWRPVPEFARNGQFGIAELILQAKLA